MLPATRMGMPRGDAAILVQRLWRARQSRLSSTLANRVLELTHIAAHDIAVPGRALPNAVVRISIQKLSAVPPDVRRPES